LEEVGTLNGVHGQVATKTNSIPEF
jgi:hypothetical protein